MPGCCETGRNVQKYRGGGGGGTASTLQEALENSNVATIDINLQSGAKFRGDGSALSNIPINGGNLNLQQVTNQDNQTTNEIIITNTGTSLSTSGAINASGNITAPSFIGSGSSLTGLNATNASSGTLHIARGGTGVTTGLTQLNAGNITSGTVPLARGGTGATSASTAADNLGLGTSDSPEFTGVNIGHASDTTITRSSAGVIAVEGQTVRTGDVALGTNTSGDYVSTITGGDGIASTGATTGESVAHSLSVDTKTNGGLAIENGKLALKLDDQSITGELGISDGGTGVTTGLTQLNAGNITSGTLTTSRGGTGVSTGLSVLNPNNLSGPVPLTKGGTGQATATAAATALGLGTNDSPQFTGISLGSTAITESLGTVSIGGSAIRTGSVALGTNTSGDYVTAITGGDGIASTGATTGETISHSLSVDTKTNGGLAIENGKLALKLDDQSITGELGISDGGTGATTASSAATALGLGTGNSPQFTGISLGSTAITESSGTVSIGSNEIRTGSVALGTKTSGDYVSTITGGNGIASTGATTGETVAHSLSVDTKTNGGLAIENGKLALKLDDQSITGELGISDGGTGATTASSAATALGLGTNDSPQFSAIELGHGSDTTIARSGPGKVTIESNEIRTGTVESDKGGTGHTSYNVGEILVANDPNNTGTPTLHKLTPGSSGYFLKSTGNGSFPTWDNVANVGSATPGQLFTGTGLTGANAISDGNTPPTYTGGHTGAGDTTISVDSATENVASKLVMRDTSGDIKVQEVIVGTTGGTTGSLTSTAWSGSAAKLTNAVTIGGQSFDGSASINLNGVNQAGNQDTSGNAATSTKLAAAVTIGGQSFDGSTSINLNGVNQAGNQNTSGNAATATKLAAAVTIGGQSFDGSASINLNGVNQAGNQNTSGNAATATKLAAAVTIGGQSFDGSASINLNGVNQAGNQDTSGKAGSIANASDSTNADQTVAFLIGNNVKINTNLTINPSTGELKATQFTAGTGGFVDSNLTNKGVIYVNSNGKLVSTPASTATGQVIKSDANGFPVWGTDNTGGTGSGGGYWTQASGTTLIYYNTGNVGIGTTTPAYLLDVNGTVNATSFQGDGANLTNVTAASITSEASKTITLSTVEIRSDTWE